MGGVISSVKVHLNHRVPNFRGQALHGAIRSVRACGKHQDVDFPNGFRQMLHILGLRGIRNSYRDIALFLRQLILKRLQTIFAARRGHNSRPFARKEHRCRAAYAAGSTDNQNCLILNGN